MYKVILRAILEIVIVILTVPLRIICLLIWAACAALWKISGSGSWSEYCDVTIPAFWYSVNAELDWIKTGTYKGWGQQ